MNKTCLIKLNRGIEAAALNDCFYIVGWKNCHIFFPRRMYFIHGISRNVCGVQHIYPCFKQCFIFNRTHRR